MQKPETNMLSVYSMYTVYDFADLKVYGVLDAS